MYVDQLRYFAFKNVSGETIPPFGVMVVQGAILEEKEIVLQVRKCTDEDANLQEPSVLLFNGIQPVGNQQYGVGCRDFPIQALVEQPSAEFVSSRRVGPKSGSWALDTSGSCFEVIAFDPTEPHIESGFGVYLVEQCEKEFEIGKAINSIPGRVGTTVSKGPVDVYYINNSDAVTKVNVRENKQVEAYNMSVDPIRAGNYVKVTRAGNKIIAEEYCQ